MWPRVVEVMLGCWMLLVPFVFRASAGVEAYTTSAWISAVVIIVASTISFWHPARHFRLVTLAAAVWLALHGYFAAPRPGPPAAQNELTVGLLVILFALLPNEINRPPVPWRRSRV